MDAKALLDLQGRIVISLARGITGIWDSAVVNIEIDIVDGEQSENCLALSFERANGGWKSNSFFLPYECYDMFSNLRTLMKQTKNDFWKSCTLEFNSDGRYRYSFSYEDPRRLNGNHDDVAMLKDYSPPSL